VPSLSSAVKNSNPRLGVLAVLGGEKFKSSPRCLAVLGGEEFKSPPRCPRRPRR
jgi:hypothetical protein